MFYVPKSKHVAALLSIDGEPKLATPFKFCHKDRVMNCWQRHNIKSQVNIRTAENRNKIIDAEHKRMQAGEKCVHEQNTPEVVAGRQDILVFISNAFDTKLPS